MDPTTSLFYCMFMVTCFETEFLNCPNQCKCYEAPNDGIAGIDSVSYVCTFKTPLLTSYRLMPPTINTLILENGNLADHQQVIYLHNQPKLLNVKSLIFQNYENLVTIPTTAVTTDIFNITNPSTLKYLSFINTKLTESLAYGTGSDYTIDKLYSRRFRWDEKLSRFTKLEAIYIKDCVLNILEADFSNVLINLHTLIITNSALRYISRDSFWTLKATPERTTDFNPQLTSSPLKKLVLTQNSLLNLNWLVEWEIPFPELHHLDLTDNHIRMLPENLAIILPNLQQLYLGGNHFKYFTEKSILPWLNIAEFIPMSIEKGTKNIMYLTSEMGWLYKLKQDIAVSSAFTFELLWHGTSYWNSLLQTAYISNIPQVLMLKEYPDQLHLLIDPNQVQRYRFSLTNLDDKGKQMPTNLIGINILQSYDRYSFGAGELFDWQSNRFVLQRSLQLVKYPEPSNKRFNDAMQIENRNSIRIVLFGENEYEYFCGRQTMTNDLIGLFIDDVVDFLDDARHLGIYVLPVLWSFNSDSHYYKSETMFYEMDYQLLQEQYVNHQFRDHLLKPLIQAIGNHPSLIGIEIVNFGLESFDPNQQDLCQLPDGDSIKERLQFIQYMAQSLTDSIKFPKEIGIGLDSSCLNCLPWFLNGGDQNCFPITQLKFVSLLNQIQEMTPSGTLYGYEQIKETMDLVRKSSHIHGIFHVIEVRDWQQFPDAPSSQDIKFNNHNIRELMNNELLGYFIQKVTKNF